MMVCCITHQPVNINVRRGEQKHSMDNSIVKCMAHYKQTDPILSRITNIYLDEHGWAHASLPVSLEVWG